jgi:hypothetical protein
VHNYRLKALLGPQLCDVATATLQARRVLADSVIHFYPITEPRGLEHLGWAEAEEVPAPRGRLPPRCPGAASPR